MIAGRGVWGAGLKTNKERWQKWVIFNQAIGENKSGSLNTGNCDVGSEDIKQAVDTREIIARMKSEILSKLKLVAAGAAWKDKYA